MIQVSRRLDEWRHFLRVQGRDALEFWLLPGLAMVLPWRLCFAVFKRLARWSWLYRDGVEAAAREAQARGWLGLDADAWRVRRRLITLVDHADFFLAATRGKAWMRRHLKVEGDWPARGQAGILCTFHWGTGTFGLRHAGLSGMRAHAMVAGLDSPAYQGRPLLMAYARRRVAMVVRETGQPTLDASGSLRAIPQVLRDGDQVLAVVDVPTDELSAAVQVELLDARALMPRGLLRMAVQRQIPMTLYLTGLDTETGARWLRIRPIGVYDDVEALVVRVFGELDEAIRAEPWSWHFWAQAPRFWVEGG